MLALLLIACGGPDPVSTADNFADWAGEPGRSLEFVRTDAPDGTPLLLEVNEDGTLWDTRYGERWSDAEPRDSFEVLRQDGLFVDEDQLLPRTVSVGSSGEGVTVTDRAPHTVWYGTFEDAALVSIDGGRFQGEAAFAPPVGPIRLSIDGAAWELAWYE